MTFEDYLSTKKIDGKAFKKSNESKYLELENYFSQMHPKSFTDQYLFLINDFRRSYPIRSSEN